MMISGYSDHFVKNCKKDGRETLVLPCVRRRSCFRVLWLLVAATILLLVPWSTFAATYYVDYSTGVDTNNGAKATPWKHAPGMTGCTNTCNSTTLRGGDTVIFKGGVTWTSSYPWTLAGGGTSYITYTTDHTWYSGGSWSQPIFDFGGGGYNQSSEGEINGSTNYVILNDLTFQNGGWESNWSTTDYSDNVNFHFADVSYLQVTNCTFLKLTWLTLYLIYYSNGGNLTFTGNDFSQMSNAIWIAPAATGVVVSNVNISNNTFHDYHNGMVQGTHGNGVHFFSSSNTDATRYITNVTFCNNRSYGDFTSVGTYVDGSSGGGMTALFFTEIAASGVICNNDFSFTPIVQTNTGGSIFGDGLIFLTPNRASASGAQLMTMQIYNNSLVNGSKSSSGMGSALLMQLLVSGDSVVFKNNIVSDPQYCIGTADSRSANALTSDYNLLNCQATDEPNSYAGGFVSEATWKGHGLDTHSVWLTDPLWTSAPGNETLTLSSPAIGTGLNLSSLGISTLGTDYAGTARPSSGAWDIGAYCSSSTRPVAPDLRIVQ